MGYKNKDNWFKSQTWKSTLLNYYLIDLKLLLSTSEMAISTALVSRIVPTLQCEFDNQF